MKNEEENQMLTENEKLVILQESEKAKDMRFCKRIETWIAGNLVGVDFEFKLDKDALKIRLNEKH